MASSLEDAICEGDLVETSAETSHIEVPSPGQMSVNQSQEMENAEGSVKQLKVNDNWRYHVDESANFIITKEVVKALGVVDRTLPHQFDFAQLIGVLYSWLLLLNLPGSTLREEKLWKVRSLHEYLNGSPKALVKLNGSTILKKGPGRLASELASSDFERYLFPLSTGKSPYERQFLPTAFEALEMDLIHYLDEAVKIDAVHRDAKGTMGW